MATFLHEKCTSYISCVSAKGWWHHLHQNSLMRRQPHWFPHVLLSHRWTFLRYLLSQLWHHFFPSQNVRMSTRFDSSPQPWSNHSSMLLCYFYFLNFDFFNFYIHSILNLGTHHELSNYHSIFKRCSLEAFFLSAGGTGSALGYNRKKENHGSVHQDHSTFIREGSQVSIIMGPEYYSRPIQHLLL